MISIASLRSTTLAVIILASSSARAEEVGKYPDWTGQWAREGSGAFDATKASGLAQQAPLTPEYLAIFEAGLASRKTGGLAYNATATCLPAGLPRAMIAYEPLEIIVTPATTYIRALYMSELRRIHTDGRGWPAQISPSFIGTAIGTWEAGPDGRYATLVIETRGFKGPRTFDDNGLSLHSDNQTIIKERIYIDAADPDRLHDEITTIDHALTRPWTVTRNYKRVRTPSYAEFYCGLDNREVTLGGETYFIGAEGALMPTRKEQPPPDLGLFGAAAK